MIIRQLIRTALAEDLGKGDITSQLTVPALHKSSGLVIARSSGTLAGIGVCAKVFRAVDATLKFKALKADGAEFKNGSILASVTGRTRSILTAERTALNFLQRLTGIATLTHQFVQTARGTKVTILDTRKTTPGWRRLEKYAVRCGGAKNHRFGLYDMILIKDNHIAAAGSVTAALNRCRGKKLPVEVEVKNLAEFREALKAGAQRIMLDNMNIAQIRRAVAIAKHQVKLEVSGRMNLGRVRSVAQTGVDYISVGALTHSAPALDIALELETD
ncbi:nicotinate-nucleotide diphosphorylase (carboxylating) [candidate division WOR-3 bacterium JGI_Cruoil_03_51_56]|uniref:Probable nicotinate-nucleotide pyrophosphorylase [carboxylating] n=1 Tax=candidate division WOR-3 bacterium JGI_Cruoil_03_51_56 TaxID=1973747 RepID=A0A235C0N9_UNCW3|nr:MAG: nicotinate-nucleotide diphosphorylase (carboxylating) [candidate division WOR-3 bacterium JGI_Cruoil_03_51_56]